MGTMRDRGTLRLVDAFMLYGAGPSVAGPHLLAAARISDVRIWTRDERQRAAAERVDVAAGLA